MCGTADRGLWNFTIIKKDCTLPKYCDPLPCAPLFDLGSPGLGCTKRIKVRETESISMVYPIQRTIHHIPRAVMVNLLILACGTYIASTEE